MHREAAAWAEGRPARKAARAERRKARGERRATRELSDAGSSISESSGMPSDLASLPGSRIYGDELVVDGIRITRDGIQRSRSCGKSISSLADEGGFNSDGLVLLNEVGRGASGRVVRALHLKTFNIVAVKSLSLSRSGALEQAVEELRAMGSTSLLRALAPAQGEAQDRAELSARDNLAPTLLAPLLRQFGVIFDPASNEVLIVMEYMDGGSAYDLMSRKLDIPEAVIAAIVLGALRSLRELHRSHRMHRDIKPANMLLDSVGGAKLSDLGLARDMLLQQGKGEHTASESSDDDDSGCRDDHFGPEYSADTFVGTMSYMSPERLRGNAYSYAADVWSLGLTIISVALLHNPYHGLSFFQTLEAVTHKPLPALPPQYSPALSRFVERCTAQDPARRASVEELLADPWLARFQHSEAPDLQGLLRAYLVSAAEGTRYKRDQLSGLASAVILHLAARAPAGKQLQVKLKLSKLRALATQLDVPVRHLVRAFRAGAG
jgi:serine/threonine protein kinase